MTDRIVLYGAPYSVYVRIIRLVLLEKELDYALEPVDIFNKAILRADYASLQPFQRIPALRHGDVTLYETSAIARYIDEAFSGPSLQPRDVLERARCNQVISIADNYVYPHLVHGIYMHAVAKPSRGEAIDEAKLAEARRMAPSCLDALANILREKEFMASSSLTLADLWLTSMFFYFMKAQESRALMEKHPNLQRWWMRSQERESMRQTVP